MVKSFVQKRMKIAYPNLDSARRPVLQDVLMPTILSPKNGLAALVDKVEKNSDKRSAPASITSTDSEYDIKISLKPILFSQECLSDIVRDLAFF